MDKQLAAVQQDSCVRIGLVGTRRLGEAREWLQSALTEIWQLTAETVPHRLRLVCGMAHGTDRAALDSFLAWRGEAPHEVLAIYPCGPDEFRNASGVEDPAHFDRQRVLLRADTRGAELVLDGRLPRGDGSCPVECEQERRVRASAHTYHSEVLIRQCEFLIAVLDRSAPGAVGGTRDALLRAAALHTPVLVLDPASRLCFLLRSVEELRPQYCPEPPGWAGDWQRKLRGTAFGPRGRRYAETAEPSLESAYGGQPAVVQRSWRGWEAFVQVFKERAAAQAAADGAAAAAQPPRDAGHAADHEPPPGAATTLALLTRSIGRAIRGKPRPVPAARTPEPPREDAARTQPQASASEAQGPGPAAPSTAAGAPTLSVWRGQIADRQAQVMSRYRGVFLANYLLGLGAVVLALTVLVILTLTRLQPGLFWIAVLIGLTALKFFVVLRIGFNVHNAEHHDFGGVAIGLRYIAERLRVMPVMLAVGCARLDLLHRTPRRNRAHEIAEDLCRCVPLAECAGVHDSHAALSQLAALIGEQRDHHRVNHATMRLLHRVLDRAVKLAGSSVIAIVCLDLVLLGAKLGLKLHWFDPCLLGLDPQRLGTALGVAGVFAVALTALLPAVMATFNAILFQSQAEQLAVRHGVMAEALAGLAAEAELLAEHLKSERFETRGSHAVLALAERTAGLMAEEVAEWATMYRQGVKET
ncbi:hypothetical protein [Tahibacter harae]|uniref:SMODS and SLOG-associating 2TM effector domain-containing protein n=1 Tax=Tahibacter harae TaxID=2963937 RepID=A0ABT1QV39_9GAMM|nr:hypothetical protein [Tahibacter harae]MCQ4166150.1 hypothetical protein [Tahibacter harae]